VKGEMSKGDERWEARRRGQIRRKGQGRQNGREGEEKVGESNIGKKQRPEDRRVREKDHTQTLA